MALRHFFLALLLFWLLCVPVDAQSGRPGRPYRGLFGSGVGDAGQSLTVSGSLSTGWDDNILAAATNSGENARPQTSQGRAGGIGSGSASLSYSLQASAFSFSAAAGTSARYFPSLEQKFIRGSQGSLSLSSAVGRTSVSAGARASYQPYTLLALFPTVGDVDLEAVPDLDAAAGTDGRLSYSANAGVSRRLAARTTLSGSYSYGATAANDGQDTFARQRGGVRLSHQIRANLSAYGGYGYGLGRFPDGTTYPQHSIDAGLDFNRALSLTRRTQVSFGTGTSATRSRDRLRFHLTGGATLTHEIGRSWSAWVAYGRSVQYHETWREPGLGNAVNFGVGGLITRRLQLSASGRAAVGSVGVEPDSPRFSSYYGNASLSYAIARFISAGLSYGYYYHKFDSDVPLASGVPYSLDRQTVRATVSMWVPIFQRSRRTDASR
jgi:hypothetical protein